MAYQFIRVETYARRPNAKSKKPAAGSIIGEATRQEGHAPHVSEPAPPVPVAGGDLAEWWARVESQADEAKASDGRKLRQDAQLLLAGVASYPVRVDQLDDAERETLSRWAQDTVEWWKRQHGEDVCAVMHLDESHPHLHLYAAPDLAAGQRMPDIHPGERAKQEASGRQAKQKAFGDAMREYQDSYHLEVAAAYGMARTGPQRRRMSRREWLTEQHTLEQTAKAIEAARGKVTDYEARADELRGKIDQALRQAAEIERQAKERSAAAAAAEQRAKKALQDVQKQRQQVEQREQAIDTWGGRLGRLWSSLRRVPERAEEAARQAYEKRLRKAQADAKRAAKEKQEIAEKAAKLAKVAKAYKHQAALSAERIQGLERELAPGRERYFDAEGRAAEAARDLRMQRSAMIEVYTALRAGDWKGARERLAGALGIEEPKPQPEPRSPAERARERDSGMSFDR